MHSTAAAPHTGIIVWQCCCDHLQCPPLTVKTTQTLYTAALLNMHEPEHTRHLVEPANGRAFSELYLDNQQRRHAGPAPSLSARIQGSRRPGCLPYCCHMPCSKPACNISSASHIARCVILNGIFTDGHRTASAGTTRWVLYRGTRASLAL